MPRRMTCVGEAGSSVPGVPYPRASYARPQCTRAEHAQKLAASVSTADVTRVCFWRTNCERNAFVYNVAKTLNMLQTKTIILQRLR
jgi:hypothetical protein